VDLPRLASRDLVEWAGRRRGSTSARCPRWPRFILRVTSRSPQNRIGEIVGRAPSCFSSFHGPHARAMNALQPAPRGGIPLTGLISGRRFVALGCLVALLFGSGCGETSPPEVLQPAAKTAGKTAENTKQQIRALVAKRRRSKARQESFVKGAREKEKKSAPSNSGKP
jgi:hypothetical protein